MTTRIALFSDIHANLPALDAVLADIRLRHAADPFDSIYCLGDIGGYAAEPNETQDLLQESGYPTLAGNYDENVGLDRDDCGCQYVSAFDIRMSDISFTWTRNHTTREHKQRLQALPHEFRFKAEGRRVLLCHGSPRSIVEYLFENRSDGYLRQFIHGGRYNAHADVICFGHTHVPYQRRVDDVEFINTGSVGRPKDGDWRAGYRIVTLSESEVTSEQIRVPHDIEATCARITQAGLPEYFADYLRSGGSLPVPAA